ncbi:Septin-type guanine nucleotide-binding (G) domain-containing protein [Gongronella butleri]|nr:Septin-type guanine nucleotide-binding (G) domain-containing protein [Gongronella butleri]
MLYNAYNQKVTEPSRRDSIAYLNVMVVGAAGTGKTAFVRTLTERMKVHMIPGTYKETKPNALKGPVRSTDELYSVSMHLDENGRRTAFSLIDTPGFAKGFDIDQHLRFLAKYIDHQFERTLAEESKVRRDAKALDTHIHACVYLVDTSGQPGLSDVDRYVIKLLSTRVNVVPIIGKADTLTEQQRDQLKYALRRDIFDKHQIPLYGYIDFDEQELDEESPFPPPPPPKRLPDRQTLGSRTLDRIVDTLQECVDEFGDDDAQTMMEYLESMPLTVMSYEENSATGRPLHATSTPASSLCRYYPWAVIDCCNEDQSDFERLRVMLLWSHRDMLRVDTFERYYEQYRTDQLLSRKVDKMGIIKSKEGKVPLV